MPTLRPPKATSAAKAMRPFSPKAEKTSAGSCRACAPAARACRGVHSAAGFLNSLWNHTRTHKTRVKS